MAVYTTIDDPSAYFQVKAYSGANSGGTDTLAVTYDGNSDLQPDLLIRKRTDAAADHVIIDSSRGKLKILYLGAYSSDAEATSGSSPQLQSFDSNGFTSYGYDPYTNISGASYVSMGWKSNAGTTSTNTDGDINSTVQVSQDSGFSIVQYSPSDSTQRTIGHGLGSTPDIVWIRARNRVEDTWFYHGAIGITGALLNSDATYNTSAASTALKAVGASTFTVGTNPVVNGAYNYIAYCWKAIQGYSKFGKYVGNGNLTNGPFVYTGFKPAFVMIKAVDAVKNWVYFDNDRLGRNGDMYYLYMNTNGGHAESPSSGGHIDFLSNGFKIYDNWTLTNQNTVNYIYMAFAENPFVTSTGIPATAR